MSIGTRPRQQDLQQATADDLDRLLVETEAAIARLRHLQTLVVREADVRQIPLGDGCRTLSEWVSGRADVNRSTADAIVRIALRDMQTSTKCSPPAESGSIGCRQLHAPTRPIWPRTSILRVSVAGLPTRAGCPEWTRSDGTAGARSPINVTCSVPLDASGEKAPPWRQTPSSPQSKPPQTSCRHHRQGIPNRARHAGSTVSWRSPSVRAAISRSTPP